MTTKETLKARAKVLARPPVRQRDASQDLEVVEFGLAKERYAIERSYLREVYPLKDLTPLPCTPPFMRGVVNVRGQIVPVINIKSFFELPESGITDVHFILIVQQHGVELAIEADSVAGARRVPIESIQASLPTLSGIRAQYLKGVTEEHVVILDAGRILSDPKLVVDEKVQTK